MPSKAEGGELREKSNLEFKEFKGLNVVQKEDGIWICFKSESGLEAALNMDVAQLKFGPIVGAAIKAWAYDQLGLKYEMVTETHRG